MPDNFGMVDGLQTADCGVRCAEKTKCGVVHNCILTKFQYKFLGFFYVKICISNTVWSMDE